MNFLQKWEMWWHKEEIEAIRKILEKHFPNESKEEIDEAVYAGFRLRKVLGKKNIEQLKKELNDNTNV